LFSFGINGGVPLTDPLTEKTFTGIDTNIRVFSGSKNYLIGPMVELNLPLGLSVEADALYRPLDLTTETQVDSDEQGYPACRRCSVHGISYSVESPLPAYAYC
jgi:hypothetical protein